MNSLKEVRPEVSFFYSAETTLFLLLKANYLKHGDSTRTNHLTVTDIHDLWEGLRTSARSTKSLSSVYYWWNFLFLWFFLSDEPTAFWRTNAKLMPADETKWKHMPIRIVRPNQPPQTDPISPTDASGKYLLFLFLPLHLSPTFFFFIAQGVRTTLGAVLAQMLPQQFPAAKSSYLIQGITPPLDTPITWLCEHLAHPDNFLYITVLASQ